MNAKKVIIKFSEFLFVMFLILSSNSIYYTSADHDYHISELLVFSIILMFILRILLKMVDTKKIVTAISFLIFYIPFMILFSLVNNNQNTYNFFCIFIILFSLCYLLYKTSKSEINIINEILEMYVNIVFFIALFSLIMYILGPILNIIKPTGIENIEWGGLKTNYSYFNVYFSRQTEMLFEKNIFRNTAIFTEGPMYSLVLTIALAIENFLLYKKNKRKTFVLVIAIFTTISTTGIIVTSLIMGITFINENKNNKLMKYFKVILFPVIIMGLIGISLYFFNAKKGTDSYNTRIDDYKSAFLAWKQHPIFGNGYGSNEAIKKYMSSFRNDNKGLSNSIMVVLAQGRYCFIFFLFNFCNSCVGI